MIGLREFLKEYNLGVTHYSRLIGVGIKSLQKYEKGESLREDILTKIRIGFIVLEKNDLVSPVYDPRVNVLLDYRSMIEKRNEYWDRVKEYDLRFKELFDKEMAQA